MTMPWTRAQMAARAARELRSGEYVNLGIGLPTMIPDHLSDDAGITVHAENGILGVGQFPFDDEVDPDLINAGKQTVTVRPGASFFGSDVSFAMCCSRTIPTRGMCCDTSPSWPDTRRVSVRTRRNENPSMPG